MINEKGFALITVTFMLVSLISLVFLTAYLAIPEQKSGSPRFLTDMDLKRYKQGLLGRLAEQCGGKFMACGGHVSDKAGRGGGVSPHNVATGKYGKRLTGEILTGQWIFYGYAYPWKYTVSDLWSGYRGKRYVHPLPCDDWDEERIWDKDIRERLGVFSTPLGVISLKYMCGYDWTLAASDHQNRLYFGGHTCTYIMVKDYSDNREYNKGHLDILLSSLSPDDHSIEDKDGYVLHTFNFCYADSYGRSFRLYKFCGLRKVLVQIDGLTRFTKAVVVPPFVSCQKSLDDAVRQGAVSIEIEYYG